MVKPGINKICLDYETRSELNIRNVGAVTYALHPSTEIMCLGYQIDDQKPKLWVPGNPFPKDLLNVLRDEKVKLLSHNAFFEHVITKFVLPKYIKFAQEIPFRRWRCSAAKAAAVALPRDLAGAGAVLKLSVQKDKVGHRLMLKHTKPRPVWSKWDKGGKLLGLPEPKPKYFEDPDERRQIEKYCLDDVRTEVLLDQALPDLIPFEQNEIWPLIQEMNFHGVLIDIPSVKRILEWTLTETKRLNRELEILTGGKVTKATQRDRFVSWLRKDQGMGLPNLQSETVKKLLEMNLSPEARRALEIRQSVGKASLKKYPAMLKRVSRDNRVKDYEMYHGASTGRGSGRGLQLQNLVKGKIKDPDLAIDLINSSTLDEIKFLYGDVFEVFSTCVRSMIIASPGHKLVVADYNAIEARVLHWMSGDKPALKRWYKGVDAYKQIASKIYSKPVTEITGDERDVGKRAELGCLAEGVPVLTDKGWIPVEQIKAKHKLWDGREWIRHGGLLRKGEKPVIRSESLNISATHDHWVRQSGVWRSFGEIVVSEHTPPQKSARYSRAGRLSEPKSESERNAVSYVAAYVELKKQLESIGFGSLKQLFVFAVPSLSIAGNPSPEKGAMLLMTEGLENVGRHVTTTLENVVKGGRIKTTHGMEVAAFDAPSSLQERFWNILLRLMGIKSGVSRWTELIMTDTMNPETYESSISQLTTEIKETFDVFEAGPKNRFQAGKQIVSNCGFGMGHKKFYATCLKYGVEDITEDLCKRAVEIYRKAHPEVVAMWRDIERAALQATVKKGETFIAAKTSWVWKDRFLWCILPSGRKLAYFGATIRWEPTPWGEDAPKLYHWSVNPVTRKWTNDATYGGKLTENVVQATARDVLFSRLPVLKAKGYRPLFGVHDEFISETKTGSLKEYEQLLMTLPNWAKGLPVVAKGWEGKRYAKR